MQRGNPSRRERLQALAESHAQDFKKHDAIQRSNARFWRIARWAALLFWPAFGWCWGFLHGTSAGTYEFSIMGLVLGAGVGVYFFLGDNWLGRAVFALLGLAMGAVVAMLTGHPADWAAYSGVGLLLGLVGRYLVYLVLQIFSFV
jgi:hypothetical protein